MADETTATEETTEETTADSPAPTENTTPQSDDQHAAWLKYQAKVEVVREVVARRGVMSTEEAKQLTDCVNAAFDGIKF